MKPRIKICCISTVEEAKLATDRGASALGLVGKMPSGPGVISDQIIREITRSVPPPVATFLLTSETRTSQIIQHHRVTRTNTLQIVDALQEGTYKDLRDALPAVKIVQVIHVLDEGSVEEAQSVAPYVDAILLDSGNPNLEVKQLGGTGRVHNWKLSRQIRDTVGVPIFLAGGLKAENVKQAIEEVNPYGLDLCSSVRSEGQLDPQKLDTFFEAAWA